MRTPQAFVEAKNILFLNGGTIWAGRRYYNRPDVSALDFKYVVMGGTGSARKDFWSQPELGTFIAHAKWNGAVQAAAAPGSPLSGSGVFGGSRQGISIGVRIESAF